jgi:glycosyltransferase involved in cell wall biosynthesis
MLDASDMSDKIIKKNPLKIIILTQYYPPEHGAPQNRLHDIAKRMQNIGINVTVLTAMPNYPKGNIFPECRGKLIYNEKIDGVNVIRTWLVPASGTGIFRQLFCYFSFAFSSLVLGVLKLPRADFLICESPPLFLGLTALLLSFAKFAKLIMNISDLWPESAVQLGILKPGLALSILERFEKLLYQKSIFVSCQTEGIATGVKKRFPEAKTFLFPNGVDLDFFKKEKKDANFAKKYFFSENSFVVGYAGNHGRSQALSQIISAAKIIQTKENSSAHNNKKIFFAFFGDGPEKQTLQESAESTGLDNLRFFDSVRREEMPHLLSQFDLALVPLKNITIFDGARPSKIFELMACGVPFVFCGRGEGAKIAELSGGAIVVPPENPQELAEAILKIANFADETREEMGELAEKFVRKNYNRAKIAEDFISNLNNSSSRCK